MLSLQVIFRRERGNQKPTDLSSLQVLFGHWENCVYMNSFLLLEGGWRLGQSNFTLLPLTIFQEPSAMSLLCAHFATAQGCLVNLRDVWYT